MKWKMENRLVVGGFAIVREDVSVASAFVPDAILLDINLGSDNGLDLLTWMRQKPELSKIPVIAVTAHALVAERERILQAGCKACFSKPIDFPLLRKQLDDWLQDRTKVPPHS